MKGWQNLKEERKTKSISFDLNDKIEAEILEYAETKKNFSRYVKRLIQTDMVSDGAVEDMRILEKAKKKKYDPKDFTIDL